MMPKSKSLDYFNACEQGGREAASELGDVEFIYNGPADARSEDQSRMVDAWRVRGVDVICIACNDQDQIAPALKRAKDAGIAVLTYDADANPATSGRDFFVNQASVQAIAEALVDEMARQAGENAQVAYVSSSPTAPNQKEWIAAMTPYIAAAHPGLKVVTTQYAGEDQQTAFEKTQELLKAYPQVTGIWGMTSVAFPGAARAVEDAGRAGQVHVVGLSLPKQMKSFVMNGVVESVILWNPVDLGYLTVLAAHAVAKGELTPGASEFQAGRLGTVQVEGDQILLGKPMRFTKENIGDYQF